MQYTQADGLGDADAVDDVLGDGDDEPAGKTEAWVRCSKVAFIAVISQPTFSGHIRASTTGYR